MTTITKARRNAARTILASSSKYDAASMIIRRDGYVTAFRDVDKTFNAPETLRYIVAHIDEMVSDDGVIYEGW